MKKADQYAVLIIRQLNAMFDPECENHIDIQDLAEGNNGTDFMHAVLNIAPSMITAKITGEKTNMLEVNHMANQLCFQYMKGEDSETNDPRLTGP